MYPVSMAAVCFYPGKAGSFVHTFSPGARYPVQQRDRVAAYGAADPRCVPSGLGPVAVGDTWQYFSIFDDRIVEIRPETTNYTGAEGNTGGAGKSGKDGSHPYPGKLQGIAIGVHFGEIWF